MNILVNDKYGFSSSAAELKATHTQLSTLLEIAACNQPLKRKGDETTYEIQHFQQLRELETALEYIIDNNLHQQKRTLTRNRFKINTSRLFKSMFGFFST